MSGGETGLQCEVLGGLEPFEGVSCPDLKLERQLGRVRSGHSFQDRVSCRGVEVRRRRAKDTTRPLEGTPHPKSSPELF